LNARIVLMSPATAICFPLFGSRIFIFLFSILKFRKLCHFIPFFAHESQYFSISIAPSTLNNAS
jgi:hypothetical protein